MRYNYKDINTMRKDAIKLYAAFACVSLLSCGGNSNRE